MKQRALHLVADHVFTRDFIDDTRRLGIDTHDFLVYTESLHGKHFVQPGANVFQHSFGSSGYKRLINKLGSHYTHLFVHWLSYEAGEAVINAPANVRTGAFFWGNDFAEPTSFYKERVFDPLTLTYYNGVQTTRKIKWRNNPRWRYALNPTWLFNTLKNKIAGSQGTQKLFEQKKLAIARLDYFLHFNDYDLIWVNVQTPTNARLIPFFYAAGYQEAASVRSETIKASEKIILGNSASTTNNHLDVLQALSGAGLPVGARIITPLSYGDNAYGKYVFHQGDEMLGKKFVPLTGFMPRDEYFQLLNETTSAVYNIKRTQALGNINAMLAMGKKVFLNKACPVYQFYTEKGFEVYDVELAYAQPAFAFEPLSTTKAMRNKEKLEENFSEALRLKYLKDILEFRNV